MRSAVLILLFTGSLVIVPNFTFAQRTTENLKDRRITIHKQKCSVGEVFGYLMVNYDVPIGFEESVLDRKHDDYHFTPNLPNNHDNASIVGSGSVVPTDHLITIAIENGTLEDVLNKLVKQMSNYTWEINDEVVNIYPFRGRDPKYEKLLELKIKDFKIEKGRPVFMIRNGLRALPEINAFEDENQAFLSEVKSDFNFTRQKLSNELNFSNITLRKLLNEITKIKKGAWILKQSDAVGSREKEHFEIEI